MQSAAWKAEPVEDCAETRSRWQELATASRSLFATPEWFDVWWTHFGAGAEPRLYAIRDSLGEIVALAPMAQGRVGPAKVLRFAGHGPADALGPVGSPENLGPALAALVGHDGGAGTLLAERIPVEGLDLEDFVVLQCEPSPVIDLSSGWEAYLASRSSNLRSQMGRKERKLQRESKLEYRLSDAAHLDADMDTLFRLHEARWGEEGSGAVADARGEFHRDFARVALERGWLRLWVAEVEGGQPIAAWYGFRYGGQEWYYQSGRDPAWDRTSIGLVLLAQTMRSAAEDGIGTYRLLRGGEQYKDRFATGDEPVVTMATSRSGAGRVALRLVRTASGWGFARRLMGRLRG